MPNYICVTCGSQHAESDTPPEHDEHDGNCYRESSFVACGARSYTIAETAARIRISLTNNTE